MAEAPYEQSMRKALSSIKDQQQEKTRNALTALAEQAQSDLDPGRRLQAAIMLAAYYWDNNYRMSRNYLGIAESLRNPLTPELSRFDAEIEHMKIRFRHAALLDADTKRELEIQLRANPQEPLRLSLVEMLLDTNDNLKLSTDYLNCYRHYYTNYPRSVRKDRFLNKAASIYYEQGNYSAYFQQLEALLDQYPISDEAKATLDLLIEHAQGLRKPSYAFTFPLMRKVYRNSSHDSEQQQRILSLADTPMRKTLKQAPHELDLVDRVRLFSYLQRYDDALKQALFGLEQSHVSARTKSDLSKWIAFILSEKGEHTEALTRFASQGKGVVEVLFQESQAKSYMSSRKFSEAAQLYGQLMRRKEQTRYRWYYFWNLLAGGNLASAKNFMSAQGEKIFNEIEFRRDASIYWKGKTALNNGQLEDAQKTLKGLLQKRPLGYYGSLAKTALNQSRALAVKQNNSEASPGEGENSPLLPKPILTSFHPSERLDQTQAESLVTVPSPSANSTSIPFAAYVHDIAKVIGIDPYLVLSIVHSESAFNAKALSTAGAQGLMQLMPYTAVRLARLLGDQDFRLEQLQTTDTNLLYGSLYLSLLLHYYGGHEIPAIAAYNAGPQVVNKWLRECQNCPVDAFVEFIPYAETRNYVKKVLNTYTGFRQTETLSDPDYFYKDLPTELPDSNIF